MAEAARWSSARAAVVAALVLLASLTPVARGVAQGLATNANPVRDNSVTLTWPAGTTGVTVAIYTQLGSRIVTRSITPDPGRFVWDLATDQGLAVANGAYMVVVTLTGGARYRRRLVVAR